MHHITMFLSMTNHVKLWSLKITMELKDSYDLATVQPSYHSTGITHVFVVMLVVNNPLLQPHKTTAHTMIYTINDNK